MSMTKRIESTVEILQGLPEFVTENGIFFPEELLKEIREAADKELVRREMLRGTEPRAGVEL